MRLAYGRMRPPFETPPASASSHPAGTDRRLGRFGPLLLVLAVAGAYADGLRGPFVFDDPSSIANNPSIRHLWPLTAVLFPPGAGQTVSGRPILNLSLALNYAFGGLNPWGYHLLNVAIHAAACLALFGVLRRTLPRFAGRDANGVALAAALLWGVHPLQTESVTYAVQRAESLMGLFYLLTLYGFIRGAQTGSGGGANGRPLGGRAWPWFALSWIACLLGVGTKEVIVSAPVMVFLYDRTFVAGSFREAWRRRRGPHLALASTWLALAALVASAHGRGGTAGFSTWMPARLYWLMEPPALIKYLGLAAWPHPLVFDYGLERRWVLHPAALVPYAAALALLAAGTAWALWRNRPLGYLGTWYFAILAPTSLVPGTRQSVADHRVYLALVPLALLAAYGGFRLCRDRRRVYAAAVAAAALAFGILTWRRNQVYADELTLWRATAGQAPDNYHAWDALGTALGARNRLEAAAAAYRRAIEVFPGDGEARSNLAWIWLLEGRSADAVAGARQALRDDPEDPAAVLMAANVLARSGHLAEAAPRFADAVRLDPDNAQAEIDWGNALLLAGDPAGAAPHFAQAARLHPDSARTWNNLGSALDESGRTRDAVAPYEEAVRLDPNLFEAHYNLGLACLKLGRASEAARQFGEAARCDPASAGAHFNWGQALSRLGRTADARRQFEAVLRLHPGDASASHALAALPAR